MRDILERLVMPGDELQLCSRCHRFETTRQTRGDQYGGRVWPTDTKGVLGRQGIESLAPQHAVDVRQQGLQILLQTTRPSREFVAIGGANEQFITKGFTQPLQYSAHCRLTEVVARGGP